MHPEVQLIGEFESHMKRVENYLFGEVKIETIDETIAAERPKLPTQPASLEPILDTINSFRQKISQYDTDLIAAERSATLIFSGMDEEKEKIITKIKYYRELKEFYQAKLINEENELTELQSLHNEYEKNTKAIEDLLRNRAYDSVLLLKSWLSEVENKIMSPQYCNYDFEMSCAQLQLYPTIFAFIERLKTLPVWNHSLSLGRIDWHLLDVIFKWARTPLRGDAPNGAVCCLFLMPGSIISESDVLVETTDRGLSQQQTVLPIRDRGEQTQHPTRILFDYS